MIDPSLSSRCTAASFIPLLAICLFAAHIYSLLSALLLVTLFPRSLLPSSYVSICSIYPSPCGPTKQATSLPAIGQRAPISAGNQSHRRDACFASEMLIRAGIHL